LKKAYENEKIDADEDMDDDLLSLFPYRDTTSFLDLINREKTRIVVPISPVPFCMFHPDRTAKSVWNVILTFLLIYTATIMPYTIAFIEADIGEPWWIVS
jgi:hypothetical protein